MALPFFFLLLALLWRNPFSTRTLIPNFEPFPDSFHYIVPARSLLAGTGFRFYRLGQGFAPSVPPLYSFVLLPAFAIHDDPRMFYFVNVLLAFISFGLFMAITRRLIKSEVSRVLLYFLYVTNFYTSWFPQWVMAENLTLPLVLLSVYLLTLPTGKWKAVIAAAIPLTFYLTKFAHGPLTMVVFVLFAIQYGLAAFSKTGKHLVEKKALWIFILASIFFLLLYTLSDFMFSGRNVYKTAWDFATMYFQDGTQRITAPVTSQQNNGGSGWFSLGYVPNHLMHHWNALNGFSEQVLWDFTPLLPRPFAVLGLVGLFIGLAVRRYRWISCSFIAMIVVESVFMSTFYAVDMRYILFVIPFLILGAGFTLEILRTFYFKRHNNLFFVVVSGIILFYGVFIATTVKSKIMLNIKYAETPWWHISVLELNKFIETLPASDKKPIVISAMPPYFIEFYSNGKYSLLPLSGIQDFADRGKLAWGDNDYSNLPALYQKYLDEGYPVYLEQYGLGNVKRLHDDFDVLSTYFIVEEKQSGCYNLCNVYQLKKK